VYSSAAAMTLTLSKTYDALVATAAPHETAREIAEYMNRFVRIESNVVTVRADVQVVKVELRA
jgi:hypothetical protein